MKKIINILMTLIMCVTLSSCVTTAQAQIDDMYGDIDVSVIVTYGTPYYNAEGLILYYIYRDMFYYPYYHHNRYYFHRYRRELPQSVIRDRYKPIPRDFYHHQTPPRRHNDARPRYRDNRPNKILNQTRPNVNPPRQNQTRPNITPRTNSNSNRPMMQPRSSSRATVNGNGRFGGRRN